MQIGPVDEEESGAEAAVVDADAIDTTPDKKLAVNSETDLESVLTAMLGNLYVKYSSLSELQSIGEGGFATVHKARLRHDNGMVQVVAVKALLKERVNNADDLTEFITEANLWRKLRSKDIVKLVGIAARDLTSLDTVRTSISLVCEHMEGGTLREAVERQMMSAKKQVYQYSDVFRWFIGIARAVKYLHHCRPAIVHRDLKPENVLLSSADKSIAEAKLIDLGLHMRNRARTHVAGEESGSFYGGSTYDAAAFNGSVYGARMAAPRTLAEKVKEAEARPPLDIATFSPPGTGTATKHNSTTNGQSLQPIEEEVPEGGVPDAPSAVLPPAVPLVPPVPAEPTGQRRSTSSKAESEHGSKHSSSAPSGGSVSGNSKKVDGVDPAKAPAVPIAHTTKVGSWLYMAPEMVSGHIYTEKVDVFSLAVMLFEALRGRLNILHIAMDGDPAMIAEYAHKVSKGHRETLPSNWPAPVKSLIEDAWHQDPTLRITAGEFLERVSTLIDSGVGRDMDENVKPVTVNMNDCGCGCSVM